MANSLQDVLHSIVDAIIGRYPVQDVENDLRRQITELGSEALADLQEDVAKIATPKNG